MNPNNKRIAKNTLMLFIRQILIMAVTLYTSRVVLDVLGVEDFGIYSVVGGFVMMFTILTGSLRSAVQRFITFEIGKKEENDVNRVFSASITVHLVIALVVLVVAEIVGVWFLNTQMNIAPDRMYAANWVFQFSLLTFVINVLAIPYNAMIIAYEKMTAFAYIGIVEVILKLAIVFTLQWYGFDKLIFYSILTFVVAAFIRYLYQSYCKRHFTESRYRFIWDRKMFVELFTFAGWNFIGVSSWMLMTQGVNILLNLYYGVTVNAARGIATQIQNAVTTLITNFMTALNPQITKSYAAGENEYMHTLLRQGARFSYYLMLILSLPILFETEIVLSVWLNKIPDYSVPFIRLSIVFALIHTLSNTLITAQLATGKIKKYQIITGGLQMLNFPLSLFALYLGASPVSTYLILVFLEFGLLFSRMLLLRSMVGLSILKYVKEVLFNVFLVTMISSIIPTILHSVYCKNTLTFIITTFSTVLGTALVVFFIGLKSHERSLTIGYVQKFISKINN